MPMSASVRSLRSDSMAIVRLTRRCSAIQAKARATSPRAAPPAAVRASMRPVAACAMAKRASATAPGRELIEHAQRIAHESGRLLAAMRRHRDGWLGQVRIGSSTTALIYHLPPVLARLRKEHPNIELVVTTGTTTGV